MQTLYSIQYLRAFAALAVVVFHAAERTGLHFAIGAAGVDVFFVVSGFIMMAISDARPTRPLKFFRDRLLRIAPAYWAATLLMIVGGVIGLFPNLKLELHHVLGSFLFIPFPSPNSGNLWPVLVQGWTLNYEIFFYAVFALTLILRPSLKLPALVTVFCGLVALNVLLPPNDALLAFYTEPLILEFLAGAALAKLWKAERLPSPAFGALLVACALTGFGAIQVFGLEFDAWSCGPLALVMVLGAISIETKGRLPVSRSLAYVGDSSYSIYLWHTFAISVAVKVGMMLALPPLLIVTAGVVSGIAAGVVGYELFEKPVQALLKKRRSVAIAAPIRQPAG